MLRYSRYAPEREALCQVLRSSDWGKKEWTKCFDSASAIQKAIILLGGKEGQMEEGLRRSCENFLLSAWKKRSESLEGMGAEEAEEEEEEPPSRRVARRFYSPPRRRGLRSGSRPGIRIEVEGEVVASPALSPPPAVYRVGGKQLTRTSTNYQKKKTVEPPAGGGSKPICCPCRLCSCSNASCSAKCGYGDGVG